MSLIHEIDYGTPRSKAEKTVTLTIDGVAVTVPEGTSIMRAAAELGTRDPEALRHRHGRGLRLLPALPGRDPGPQRHACLLHHAGRRRHGGAYPDRAAEAAAQGRDGALHLRASARLPDLLGQWRLRAAGHGRRGRLARGALRLRRQAPPQSRHRRFQSLFHLRAVEVHRLLALRAGLRGGARHLRADHRRARLRVVRLGEQGRAFPRVRMRVLRRLRAGLPDRDAEREDR